MRIWEFPVPYVLHTKFALADVPRGAAGAGAAAASAASGSAAGEAHAASPVGLIGSSNMDIRSFSLNYESTLLIAAGPLLDQLDRLAQNYMAVSHELTLERWDQRPWYRRYVDNVMKLTSAVQ